MRAVRRTIGKLTVYIVVIKFGIVTVVAFRIAPQSAFDFIMFKVSTAINNTNECAFTEGFIALPSTGHIHIIEIPFLIASVGR